MTCSILVANYNSSRFLKVFIESILKQSHEDWELIVVDDGSTDNSIKEIKLHTVDDRIKLFYNESNMGVGYTKRRAASLSSGDILMFADPDDALVPQALEKMVASHKNQPDASLVYSTFYYCDENLEILGVADWVGDIPPTLTNLHADKVSHLAAFKKKYYKKTGGINSNLKAAVDKDLYYKLEEVGAVKYLNEPLYLYRKNPAGVSQSSNSNNASESGLKVFMDAYRRRLTSGFPNVNNKSIKIKHGVHFHEKALIESRNGNYLSALFALSKSFRFFPSYKMSEKFKVAVGFYFLKFNLLPKL